MSDLVKSVIWTRELKANSNMHRPERPIRHWWCLLIHHWIQMPAPHVQLASDPMAGVSVSPLAPSMQRRHP
jgi:hypothetical protein